MTVSDYCPNCKTSVCRNKSFCYRCGTKLIERPRLTCPAGHEAGEVDTFCETCGIEIPKP